ncbi:hypothetical protein ACWIID_18220 [Streptomyces phaeochromogenes]
MAVVAVDTQAVLPTRVQNATAPALAENSCARRRHIPELDDDEAGRRERRRLSKESRRMNLQVRTHRYDRAPD